MRTFPRLPSGRFVPPLWASGIALALLLATPALSGEIRLKVLDESGGRAVGVRLSLSASEPGLDYMASRLRNRFAETDISGHAVFSEVAPGRYTIDLRGTEQPFVSPSQNPFAPPPQITLEGEQSRVELQMELWRGAETVFGITVNRGEIRGARIFLRELDHGLEIELALRNMQSRPMRLVPGRWEARMEPVRGHLLLDVEINGRSVEGHRPFLELESLMPTNFVTWHWNAPAELWGRVGFEGEPFGVQVVARLVEPGPWIEAAVARGGADFQQVAAGVDTRTGRYEMVLPDGRWEVGLESPTLEASDPETVLVDVPAAGSARQDFSARGSPGAGSLLIVEVRDPENVSLRGATVEIWPANAAIRDESPILREETRWGGKAYIRGLAGGEYLIAAGLAGFAEGRVEYTFDPTEEDEIPRATVRLKRGASVHVTAERVDGEQGQRDQDEEPRKTALHGIALTLERLDRQPPDIVISEPDLVQAMLAPTVKTDVTGHAWIKGVLPGKYRLSGELSGLHGGDSFVRFREGRDLVADLDLQLADGVEEEITAVLVPAASVHGRLVCTDEQPSPGIISVAVVPSHVDLDELGEDQGAWEASVSMRQPELALTGKLHERFRVGPLEQGAYHLAFQFAGHDRWTWAFGTEQPGEAATIHATMGEPNELGTIEVDCAPAIRVIPRAPAEDRLPDLGRPPPARTSLRFAGSVRDQAGESIEAKGRVEILPQRVMLRDLPEGDATLHLVLSNGYFLPRAEIDIEVEATLERGRTVDVVAEVPALGGIISIIADAPAARIHEAEGKPRIERASDGRIVFHSVAPGEYAVELCANLACTTVLGTLSAQVDKLRTLQLTP